jgi:hypothetical protein
MLYAFDWTSTQKNYVSYADTASGQITLDASYCSGRKSIVPKLNLAPPRSLYGDNWGVSRHSGTQGVVAFVTIRPEGAQKQHKCLVIKSQEYITQTANRKWLVACFMTLPVPDTILYSVLWYDQNKYLIGRKWSWPIRGNILEFARIQVVVVTAFCAVSTGRTGTRWRLWTRSSVSHEIIQ